MNIEQLKAVCAIADLGTYTKAADLLCLTQPALTQQIQSLEAELGEKLFEARGRTKCLSRAGQLVLSHARTILADLSRLEADLAAHRDLCKGELVVAAGDNLARRLLVGPVGSFARTYPGIGMHMRNRTSPEIIQLVRSGGADLGLVSLPLDCSGLCLREWRRFSWMAAGLGGRLPEEANLESLSTLPLVILEPGTHQRSTLDQALAQAGLQAQRVLEVGSTDLQIDFAAQGMGIAVIPDYALEPASPDSCGLVARPIPDLAEGRLGLVWRGPAPSTACQAFMDHLTRIS